jgi:very-short-patch-repair endonuclease
MYHKNYIPRYIIQLSRQMRAEMTETEKILWSKLSSKKLDGFRFRKQHPIGRYIADFFCHSLKLVIEIDGGIHSTQKEYDKNRDNYLSAQGYTVLRFSDKQIKGNPSEVITAIKNFAVNHVPHPSSPPPGDLGGP